MAPSRRVRRRRRQVAVAGVALLVLLIVLIELPGGTPGKKPAPRSHPRSADATLTADWRGDGKPVTLAFGGDVHFEGVLADRLATDPSTALGPGTPQLLTGAAISVANLDSAVIDANATCTAQQKPYVFSTNPTAFTALAAGHVTVASMANNHGEDCGPTGLTQSLAAAATAPYPVIGIGQNQSQAMAPYRVTVDGQRIAIIAATQVFDPGFQATTTATATSPGLASAYSVKALLAAVEAARRTADTVVVYLHWGVDTETCPDPEQPPLARALVQAGADIVVGTNAHVQQGTGYLGQALVDYGLGNLAFYDTSAPETSSGALLVTVTGRHIDAYHWRPALLEGGVPVPLTGTAATTATTSWAALRGCAGLAVTAGPSLASVHTERVAPPARVVSTLSVNSTTTTTLAPATTTTTTTGTSG